MNSALGLLKEPVKRAIHLPRYALRRSLARRSAARKIANVDGRRIPDSPHEIRAFLAVRNESLRLPYMLKHHFGAEVDRIFVLDNNSTDDTASIVLSACERSPVLGRR